MTIVLVKFLVGRVGLEPTAYGLQSHCNFHYPDFSVVGWTISSSLRVKGVSRMASEEPFNQEGFLLIVHFDVSAASVELFRIGFYPIAHQQL